MTCNCTNLSPFGTLLIGKLTHNSPQVATLKSLKFTSDLTATDYNTLSQLTNLTNLRLAPPASLTKNAPGTMDLEFSNLHLHYLSGIAEFLPHVIKIQSLTKLKLIAKEGGFGSAPPQLQSNDVAQLNNHLTRLTHLILVKVQLDVESMWGRLIPSPSITHVRIQTQRLIFQLNLNVGPDSLGT